MNLSMEKIYKAFGSNRVLHGVDFTLGSGENNPMAGTRLPVIRWTLWMPASALSIRN